MNIVNSVKIAKTGYGQYTISIDTNIGPFKSHSTNSNAVDGKDGFQIALAKEVLQKNYQDVSNFDFSSLSLVDEEI